MPTDSANEMILPSELLLESLLWRECKCRSPLSQTPSVRLAMGGSGPNSTGAHGLLWLDCPWPEPPRKPAIVSPANKKRKRIPILSLSLPRTEGAPYRAAKRQRMMGFSPCHSQRYEPPLLSAHPLFRN